MTHSPSSAQSVEPMFDHRDVADLMDCPFCGGRPSLHPVGNNFTKSRKLTVKCTGCRVQLTNAAIRNDFNWLRKITAEAWNRRAAASAHTIGEDAANVAMGEREAYLARFGTENESLAFAMRAIAADAYDTGYATARAAVSAEKVAGQEPYGYAPVHPNGNYFTRNKSTADYVGGLMPVYAAPQQPAQPVAQTPALTDEQREAIEYAVRWMDENVSNRYAHTATKELRALLAAQPASSLAEGGERE